MSTPFLSIIIPAYNEEHRLPNTLKQAANFLNSQPYRSEVIIVENGSTDKTLEIAQRFSRENPGFQVLHEEKSGKGLAVQRGMLAARGEYRFMCDADFSMPVDQINRFFPPVLRNFDVAIASREAPGAIRFHEPQHRHLGGRLLNLLIRLLVLPGLHDTQCGFKCFTAQAAETLFRNQTLEGWSFDIEILFLARKLGLSIIEVPIPWYFNPESKLNLAKDAIKMSLDILKIRQNDLQGVYKLGKAERKG